MQVHSTKKRVFRSCDEVLAGAPGAGGLFSGSIVSAERGMDDRALLIVKIHVSIDSSYTNSYSLLITIVTLSVVFEIITIKCSNGNSKSNRKKMIYIALIGACKRIVQRQLT